MRASHLSWAVRGSTAGAAADQRRSRVLLPLPGSPDTTTTEPAGYDSTAGARLPAARRSTTPRGRSPAAGEGGDTGAGTARPRIPEGSAAALSVVPVRLTVCRPLPIACCVRSLARTAGRTVRGPGQEQGQSFRRHRAPCRFTGRPYGFAGWAAAGRGERRSQGRARGRAEGKGPGPGPVGSRVSEQSPWRSRAGRGGG
ncbi:hypothetical protein GCM10010324_68570 [Streptomyces hiroshimensis]|uniref:Uncharacterized protein n=1 Tax=Streptomyces hiroshimensis TaxID=66424 RepID=A0ABQ2ZFT9_9ACTN|nr:hypothetical protein GCM10010324_68570 [Streptomyces hiroshimensis]